MAPSKKKPVREFIPVGAEESSDDEFAAILGNKNDVEDDAIGLDEEFSDDGEGLYSDDEEEEVEEDDEEDDDEEEDDAEQEVVDEEGNDEDEEFEMGSEFSDGDPDELAQEGDEDESDEESGEEDEEEGEEYDSEDDGADDTAEIEQPAAKKPRGLGELARKLAALEEEIADFETKQIDKKHWTLTGEVAGKARPVNSLLESNLELPFGHMAGKRLDESRDLMVDENDFDPENPEKPVFDLELIIRQRVADRTFDDVLRKKVETTVQDLKPSDALEGLDFEKSQLGLAEVYAKQYEKDIFNQSDETEKVTAEKEEAKRIFAKLMHKLDCLTNFNFAPRPPVVKKAGGADGIKDLPAMKLEEAIPLVISSSVRANS